MSDQLGEQTLRQQLVGIVRVCVCVCSEETEGKERHEQTFTV